MFAAALFQFESMEVCGCFVVESIGPQAGAEKRFNLEIEKIATSCLSMVFHDCVPFIVLCLLGKGPQLATLYCDVLVVFRV